MASGTSGSTTWNLDESTWVLTISGTGAMSDNEYGWRTYIKSIKKVIIEDGVTRVCNSAFNNSTSIEYIELGKDVTSLGVGCFAFCYNASVIKFNGAQPTFEYSTMTYNGMTITSYNQFNSTTTQPTWVATVYTKGGWGSDEVFNQYIRGDNSTFTYKSLGANVNVNVSGTWKESTPYVNVNGTWKEVTNAYVNVNGTWKEVT